RGRGARPRRTLLGAARPGGAGGAARRYAGPRDLRVARGRSGPRRRRYADRGGLPRLRPPGGALDAPRARAEGADQEGPDLHGLGAPATPARAARGVSRAPPGGRSEEHTSELQSRGHLVCRLLLEKKKQSDI